MLVAGHLHNLGLYERRVAVNAVQQLHEQRQQYCADDGFDTETVAEDKETDNQQGHVHAEGRKLGFHAPKVVEYDTEAVGPSRSESVGLYQHHRTKGKDKVADNQQQILFYVCFKRALHI